MSFCLFVVYQFFEDFAPTGEYMDYISVSQSPRQSFCCFESLKICKAVYGALIKRGNDESRRGVKEVKNN